MKPVVLFVDDDANILRGLRRMLRGQRDRWEMLFAEGGQAAIDVMNERDVDVVVSDMRMPDVDGAMVMEHAQHAAPRALRVILSGESDRALTMRTVGISHRFFAKPCDTSAIIAAVERPLALKQLFAPQFDGGVPGDLMRLWTPADIYEAFHAALAEPTTGIADIAALASNDPALTVRLLQLANSAYFNQAAAVCTAEAAVERLGLETLREVAGADRLTALGPSRDHEDIDIVRVRPQALAEAASDLAETHGGDDELIDVAGCVGLLYGLGARAELSAGREGAEREAAVSAYLVTLMGLPERLCEALCGLAQGDVITDDQDGARRIVDVLTTPLSRAA